MICEVCNIEEKTTKFRSSIDYERDETEYCVVCDDCLEESLERGY